MTKNLKNLNRLTRLVNGFNKQQTFLLDFCYLHLGIRIELVKISPNRHIAEMRDTLNLGVLLICLP